MQDYQNRVRLTVADNPNCYRQEIVGRLYCKNKIDLWVKNVAVPAALNAKEKLEVEDFFFSSTRPFPFGGEFNKTIDAYALHLNAWERYLERAGACADYSCYDRSVIDPNAIDTSFYIAERAFYSVIPKPDLVGSKNRIEKIFKDERIDQKAPTSKVLVLF